MFNLLREQNKTNKHSFTHINCKSAGLCADICTCKSKWLITHLTQGSHESVVWDADTDKLQGETPYKKIIKTYVHFSALIIDITDGVLTLVNGLRSAFSVSDLSKTKVTGPGRRSFSSSSFTVTLQYLQTKHA